MTALQQPVTVRTLGDFLRYPAHRLAAHCPRCQHYQRLNVRELVGRFGGDVTPAEIAPLLKCVHCQHRGGEITISHDGKSDIKL